MNGKMKILIAYDGSENADAALEDLRRAGLPCEAQAVVVTAADVLLPPTLPPPDHKVLASSPASLIFTKVQIARREALSALREAHSLAAQGAKRLKTTFPAWEVSAVALAGAPGWGVIQEARRWKPDLVVVGSQGRSALGRLILGSVSRQIVTEANCSVRVARRSAQESGSPVKVIVGVDGSPSAEVAIRAVTDRSWPPGSEVRVIAALNAMMPTVVAWVRGYNEGERAWVYRMVEATADELRVGDMDVSTLVKEGEARSVLLGEAESWRADCIFVGARGLNRLERSLLGSVSSAVATNAHCSVEVVRQARAEATVTCKSCECDDVSLPQRGLCFVG